MFKGEKTVKTETKRKSKLGKIHVLHRTKTFYFFSCDSCGEEFSRAKGKIEKKRLTISINTCVTNAILRSLLNNKASNKDKFLKWTHQVTHL